MEAEPDEDAGLLEWVYHRSLSAAVMEARWLRRKNVKVLRIAIERSEREVAWLAKLKRHQDREVRWLKGLVILSDDDDDDHDSSLDDSDDSPPAIDSYSCADGSKGKGPARKW
ncbi:Phosphorylated carbohydrates phosphatase [Hordeum vulgare]|nr:Phosphorylated carbohydrates phosphatase [Hordeum vulgare]